MLADLLLIFSVLEDVRMEQKLTKHTKDSVSFWNNKVMFVACSNVILRPKNTCVSANPTDPVFCADPAIFIASQKKKK